MSDLDKARVEAAAVAMWDLRKLPSDPEWDTLEYGVKQEYRKDARAALDAALPHLIDVDELAKVIADARNHWAIYGDSNVGLDEHVARAVAEYLGMVK